MQLVQIMADLNGIGDFKTLTVDDVTRLYKSLIPSLKETTKPKE